LRARAWAAAASVVDPEMPVLTIADLGVLRDVAIADDGTVEVSITPTYSGCPAMTVIALEVELALERAGIADARVKTVLSPAWTTDWMSEDGRRKLKDYGIAPPAPKASRRALFGVEQDRLPAMRVGRYREARRVRLDRLQGAVALQELPRAVRPFQMHLIR
jgi:ring-1,2-phenylacetyl-CoA epoxidase subunit PaaD